MAEREFDLESLLELRHLSRSDIESRFDMSRSDVTRGVRYERAQGLDRLANDESAPVAFYFKRKNLVMMYIGSHLEDAERQAVVAKLGAPPAELRSRAGKSSTLYVYPEVGFAFSSSGDDFDFMEVFPPTTLERYRQEIYEEPPAFVR